MGKKSTKENKNIYQITREQKELTREQASELMGFVSADKIEKIENEKVNPQAYDILAMSRAYKAPHLCNYYCTHECDIGIEYVPEIEPKDLEKIILELIATLNTINKEKDRIIEIASDGQITEDEFRDFNRINQHLMKVSLSVDSLRFWIERTIANGYIDEKVFNSYKD